MVRSCISSDLGWGRHSSQAPPYPQVPHYPQAPIGPSLLSDDLHDPKGLARGPRADQSLRGLGFCLAVWQPRPAVSPPGPSRDSGAGIARADFSPSQYFLPACLANEKTSQASEEDCGRDSFGRDKELKEGRISPSLQSKPQTPAGGVRLLHVCKQPGPPAWLCEHRGSRC